MSVILLGLLTGLDNFIVSAGFGTLRPGFWYRAGWIATVALAETLMPLAGFFLFGAADVGLLGPWMLLAAGALVLWGAAQGRARWPYAMMLAPIGLSFDNLAAGAGLAATGFDVWAAAVTGTIAATVGLAGLWAGRLISLKLPVAPQVALSACLIAVGLFELAE